MLESSSQQDAILNTALAISGALLIAFLAVTRLSLAKTPKGCRKLGLPPGRSNLHDEYDPKYTLSVAENSIDETGRPGWRVKALFTYPIKSCAGIELDVADVVSTGFAFDRQFCFAEDLPPPTATTQSDPGTNWTARTLRDRDFNRLTLIRPEIWVPDPSASDYSLDLEEVKSNGVMVIYYPRVGHNILHSLFLYLGVHLNLITRENSYQIPLQPPPTPGRSNTYTTTPVKIWKDHPQAYDYGHHIPDSLHRFFTSHPYSQDRDQGRKRRRLTLFRVNPSNYRQIFRNAPRKNEIGFQPVTGFADAYPLHILNLTSVRDVASHCAYAIPSLSIRRFRANIILQGPDAFVEDTWKQIRISPPTWAPPPYFSAIEEKANNGAGEGTVIHTVCRTIRCKLPNVDPDTGIRHPAEPDKTLKGYRRIDPGDLTNACLGMQGVPALQEFRIRVGDAVSVLGTGEHRYIKMLAPGEVVEGV
ncbi:hypothetical protein BDW59DRAFT_178529 [Aspergillus cavernicola]|uniref:MOSC domain-containing protein n=1 Tax=Aspergillus cavernicola TaxID=176166 RepID=A0ABR4HD08_9EURO